MIDLAEVFEIAKARERDDAIDAESKNYDERLTKPVNGERMVFERSDVAKDPPEHDPY